MERRVADILNAATSRFYVQQARSFSQTRQSAWPGWERCLPYLDELAAAAGASTCTAASSDAELCGVTRGEVAAALGDAETHAAAARRGAARPLSLVDLGCGNLRFEAFLKAARPNFPVELTAIDLGAALFEQARPGIFDDAQNSSSFDDTLCGDAVCPAGQLDAHSFKMQLASFQDIDVITQALERKPLLGIHLGRSADTVLCFGFMHHVPGRKTREFALREMLKLLRPGGILAVSFWQFMKSPKLAEQTGQLREQALFDLELVSDDLEEGDHLLGWQKASGVYRYCHSFGEAELDSLAGALSDLAKLEARFEADGRTGNLNSYLILRRK
ncbi:MAG: class I SAM-dependent methyltransferase [Coriobacteriia bacterium]|nr:class I SAM-dependent methyltransferase [Coriobacteriia bacterium]